MILVVAKKARNRKYKQKQRDIMTEEMKQKERKLERERGSLRRLKMTDEQRKKESKRNQRWRMKQSNAWREKERDRLKQWRIKKKKAISLIKTTSSASIITNVNKINENNITPILDGLPINHVTEIEKGLHNRRQDNNTTKSSCII